MDEHTLSAEQIQIIARLCWGSRNDGGSEALANFLGINHRNALRLLSGELAANAGVSAELMAEFCTWLQRSGSAAALLIRYAMEPELT